MSTDQTTRTHAARPDKHGFDTLSGNTWSVHGGNHADETTGAIRSPIVMANSYCPFAPGLTWGAGDPSAQVGERLGRIACWEIEEHQPTSVWAVIR